MSEPRARILIVEDEAIVALDLQQQLEALGHKVVGKVQSAGDAQHLAGQLHPDLVLMDIHLEGNSDGIEAARSIRETQQTPIIFVTAYVDEATIERATVAEPYGYVVKPFDEKELDRVIQLALYKSQADRQIRESRNDLQAILDSQRQGTLMVDAEEQITFLSRAARTMLRTDDAALGRHWRHLPALADAEQEKIAELLRRSEAPRGNLSVALHSNTSHELHVEIEVCNDPRDPRRRIFFLYDVSQLHGLRELLDERAQFQNIVGKSNPMQQVFQLVRQVAAVDSSVLIEGETGTGKELVARAIHDLSRRASQPFVALNCAGLGEELALSQLFGHKRGAFTGAIEDQAGHFEWADGGTLFLDEIGELPLRVQTMLLRVLEESAVRRLGEPDLRKVDVRLLAATNRRLGEEVARQYFRADLLYRLRVARVVLPPLRERRDDLPLLVRKFVVQAAAEMGKPTPEISQDVLCVLAAYDWPGNVRELKNAIEFGVLRVEGRLLQPHHLSPELLESAASAGLLNRSLTEERGQIQAALERTRGNRKEAAKLLGISRATFYRRIAELGLLQPNSDVSEQGD